ncbi:MAG: toll/interleukin-1 receptor domain-containing protein [Caldimonas sp.]
MSARVFISYRSSDGADKATALARDLDAMFGDEQIFLDKEDLVPGSRWRDGIVAALGNAPVLLVLVTPNYLGALDAQGQRCIDRTDDPARDELEAGIAAKAHVIPLLCDGVDSMPAAPELPKPFDHLCELQWGRLRAYDWRADMGRLADDLCGLGLTPRPLSAPGTFPLPMNEPTTTPMPLVASGTAASHGDEPAVGGRRSVLGLAALAVLGVGGWGFWRWRQRRAALLTGPWRARIGAPGAPTSREGELMIFTLAQQGENLRLTSNAVDIERDPAWENYRDFWKGRTGKELNSVFYRGEGKIVHDDDAFIGSRAAPAAASDADSDGDRSGKVAATSPKKPGLETTRPVALRRVVVEVHIATPGTDSETIDEGLFRGIVDTDDQRIHGRLWLRSEQADRVMDLRRGN